MAGEHGGKQGKSLEVQSPLRECTVTNCLHVFKELAKERVGVSVGSSQVKYSFS